MEKKKETRDQLERKIKNALVFVPRDKDYQGIYFSDKGLRMEVTSEHVIIGTLYHQHVFSALSSSGYSRPYIYTKRMVEIANDHLKEMETEDGYSLDKLCDVLSQKEDKTEYNIVTYVKWWSYNIFSPLYSIGESDAEAFLVYENYVHNIVRNQIILDERKEDITNKQFFQRLCETMVKINDANEESVVLPKMDDEDVVKNGINLEQEQ